MKIGYFQLFENIIFFFFCFRKREEEKKREVLNNPVKMKKIKELVGVSQYSFTDSKHRIP